jgi:hypothetical protein
MRRHERDENSRLTATAPPPPSIRIHSTQVLEYIQPAKKMTAPLAMLTDTEYSYYSILNVLYLLMLNIPTVCQLPSDI